MKREGEVNWLATWLFVACLLWGMAMASFEQQIDDLHHRLDAINRRLDALDYELDRHDRRIDTVMTTINRDHREQAQERQERRRVEQSIMQRLTMERTDVE